MHRLEIAKLFSVLSLVALAGCGGGGGESPSPAPAPAPAPTGNPPATGGSTGAAPSLTVVQQAAQDSYSSTNGGTHGLSGSFPLSGPASLNSYVSSTHLSIDGLLSQQAQVVTSQTVPLAGNQPNVSPGNAARVLSKGAFIGGGPASTGQQRIRLDGDAVVSEQVLVAQGTLLSAIRLTAIEAVPLSGTVALSPAELAQGSLIGSLASNPSLLKPAATYLPGSKFLKRFSVRHGDVFFMGDCIGNRAGVTEPAPMPCGDFNKLEDAFPYSLSSGPVSLLPASPFTSPPTDTYQVSNGAVQTIQGLRGWVSNDPLPSSAYPTATYLFIVEREGKVYQGTLQRDGTKIRSASSGIALDYAIVLNKQAVDSVKAALTF